MGMSFNWWITCFEQAIQFPPSLFFGNISWHPKTAGSPFFTKTWQWPWGYFCWSCGKFQYIQSGYYIPASQKWLPLSPAKHLLPLHWKRRLYLDICVQPAGTFYTNKPLWQKSINLLCHSYFSLLFRKRLIQLTHLYQHIVIHLLKFILKQQNYLN